MGGKLREQRRQLARVERELDPVTQGIAKRLDHRLVGDERLLLGTAVEHAHILACKLRGELGGQQPGRGRRGDAEPTTESLREAGIGGERVSAIRSRVAESASAPITARSAESAVRRLVRALSSTTFGHSRAATVDRACMPGCIASQPSRTRAGRRAGGSIPAPSRSSCSSPSTHTRSIAARAYPVVHR